MVAVPGDSNRAAPSALVLAVWGDSVSDRAQLTDSVVQASTHLEICDGVGMGVSH